MKIPKRKPWIYQVYKVGRSLLGGNLYNNGSSINPVDYSGAAEVCSRVVIIRTVNTFASRRVGQTRTHSDRSRDQFIQYGFWIQWSSTTYCHTQLTSSVTFASLVVLIRYSGKQQSCWLIHLSLSDETTIRARYGGRWPVPRTSP